MEKATEIKLVFDCAAVNSTVFVPSKTLVGLGGHDLVLHGIRVRPEGLVVSWTASARSGYPSDGAQRLIPWGDVLQAVHKDETDTEAS